MAPNPNTTVTTTPMRQSCDRCHRQKLRCTRSGNSNTGACNRCLTKRTQCVYSSSLPKGRPSMYRWVDETTGIGNPVHSDPPVVASVTSANSKLCRRYTANSQPEISGPHGSAHSSTNMSIEANANAYSRENSVVDTSASMSTDTWSWLESLNWDDAQMALSDHDMNQPMLNWHAVKDTHPNAISEFPESLPELIDWDLIGNGGGVGDAALGLASTQPWTHSHGYGHDFKATHPESNHGSTSSSDFMMTLEENTTEVVLARLSQLSMRLSPLRRISCNLAEASEASRQSRGCSPNIPLIDDATFESVTAFLTRSSSDLHTLFPTQSPYLDPGLQIKKTGDILHHVFSASHDLLDIFRCLQTGVSSPFLNSASSTSTPSMVDSSDDKSYFGLGQPAPVDNSTNTIVRHLILVCHTLLFSIYETVLTALRHDAQPRDQTETTTLDDIRLLSVCQLCSYLVESQHQAVNLYLSTNGAAHESDISGSHPPALPMLLSATREVMNDQRLEVQKQLSSLQQVLRI